MPNVTTSALLRAIAITRSSPRFSTWTVLAEKMRALAAAYASMVPCQSRWSCVTLSTAAASHSSERVVASWKLDSSSTQASGRLSPASASRSTSSTAGAMLPATATFIPERSSSSPASRVVVVLPLVPVMPTTFGA